MGLPGIILILAAAAISCSAEATARGKIGINPVIGLRIGYVTYSSEAWLDGHRAARVFLHAAGAVLAVAGILLLAPLGITEAAGVTIGVAACLASLGLIIAASVRANWAAEATVVRSVDAKGAA